MRSLMLTLLTIVILNTQADAQYQKMAKANSLNVSGFGSHLNIGWSKQLSNSKHITITGFYFQDDARAIATDNFGGNLSYNSTLLRLGNAYFTAGPGLFFAHTSAKSPAGIEASDFSVGLDLLGELEYYASWWLVFFGRANQMVFFTSDFFNSKFILSGGIKIVF